MTRVPWQHRFWRAFYDYAAFAYDAVVQAGARLGLGSEERIRREVIGVLELPAGAPVLEVGCGTAANRAFLPTDIHYIGLDLSRGMLTRARRTCGHHNLSADFVQADSHSLPLAASCVEISLAMGVIQHSSEPERAIHEMERVTKSGGSQIIIDERRHQRRIQDGASGYNSIRIYGEYFVLIPVRTTDLN